MTWTLRVILTAIALCFAVPAGAQNTKIIIIVKPDPPPPPPPGCRFEELVNSDGRHMGWTWRCYR